MMLYHSSQSKNLKVILPQRTLSNDKYIGDYVFATSNLTLAAMYLIPKGFAILMHPETATPILVVCGDDRDLKQRDHGGAIYELNPEGFVSTPQKGLELYEMVSQNSVIPIASKIFDSIFDAFNQFGIVVKYVDHFTFETLVQSPDQLELITKL